MSGARTIIGGSEGGDDAIVALASVFGCEHLDAFCSGVLIAPRVVITAAHCVDNLGPDNLEVFLGPQVGAPSGVWAAVEDITVHPRFDAATLGGDLALLRLVESPGITPLPRADIASTPTGTRITAVGFGTESLTGTAGTKRTAELMLDEVYPEIVIATPAPGITCHGDSGGAVLAPAASGGGLLAVVSAGDARCEQLTRAIRVDAAWDEFVAPYLADTESATSATSPTCAPEPDVGCRLAGGDTTGVVLVVALALAGLRTRRTP